MAPSRRSRWLLPPRSTAPTTASARCARSTSAGATCWWNRLVARAGRCLLRAPRCSLGRRSRSRSRLSAASNFPHSWSKRPRSRSRRASASANMAKDTCASRWSRTSSVSVKPRAMSAAFLKPASKSCTTSSPWPSGARRSVPTQADDVRSTETRYCRLGHGRGVRRPPHRAPARRTRRSLRPPDRGRRSHCALAQQEARHRSQEIALGRRPRNARDRSRDRRLRGVDRRGGGFGAKTRSRPHTKAFLPRHGVALAAIAEKNHVALNFEAAVGGAIPIVKTLREGLAGNSLARIYGILNGTCNYILTRMEEEKLAFAD